MMETAAATSVAQRSHALASADTINRQKARSLRVPHLGNSLETRVLMVKIKHFDLQFFNFFWWCRYFSIASARW